MLLMNGFIERSIAIEKFTENSANIA